MALGKRSIERALQKVLGRGANISGANPLEVHDPKVGSLISYEGTTTADGAGDGSSLIDSVLTTKPDYDGNLVVITSGAYAGQARDIDGTTTGTVIPTSAFGGQILRGTSFVIVALRLTPAEVAAIEAKLDHATHGLAALKALIDAVEGKLDIPANFMADVSALALEATLGTHDTDIKALLGTIAGYIDTEIAAIITSQGRMLFSMDFWSASQEEVQVPQVAATLVITPTVTVGDLPTGATIVRAIPMFKFRMIENIYAGVNNLDGATVAATSQVIQVKETTAGAYIDGINFVDGQYTLAASTREGGDVLIGSIDVSAQVDANGNYTFRWLLRKAAQDFINFNDVQCGLRIWYSV